MNTRRIAAAAALVLVVGVVVATITAIAGELGRALGQLALFVVVLAAGWMAVTRSGSTRIIAVVVAVAAVVAIALLQTGGPDADLVSLVLRIIAVIVAIGLARYAIGTTTRDLQAGETPGTPVEKARNGVLFMNLKSGGGKAERFHLVDECRARGIEPVVLEGGQDWVAIIRETAPKHDVVGMAGGDGSQALVGSIAAELGLPMVVVPAGTRNHLALDLGLDRDDVVGALDAYGDAVERPMDLADVNGSVFVNNVSLGVYAAIVRSPEYRDAKVDTTLAALPKIFGPGATAFDLRFDSPTGTPRASAPDPGVEQSLRGIDGRLREPASARHEAARGRVAHHRGRSRDGAVPRRAVDRPAQPFPGPRVLGDADLRGIVRRADRDRSRRGDPADGLAAAVLHQAGAGSRASAEVGHRVLARRPCDRMEGREPSALERAARQTGRPRGLTLLIVCPRSHAGVGVHAFPGATGAG